MIAKCATYFHFLPEVTVRDFTAGGPESEVILLTDAEPPDVRQQLSQSWVAHWVAGDAGVVGGHLIIT